MVFVFSFFLCISWTFLSGTYRPFSFFSFLSAQIRDSLYISVSHTLSLFSEAFRNVSNLFINQHSHSKYLLFSLPIQRSYFLFFFTTFQTVHFLFYWNVSPYKYSLIFPLLLNPQLVLTLVPLNCVSSLSFFLGAPQQQLSFFHLLLQLSYIIPNDQLFIFPL